jgi:hypothetical protein
MTNGLRRIWDDIGQMWPKKWIICKNGLIDLDNVKLNGL